MRGYPPHSQYGGQLPFGPSDRAQYQYGPQQEARASGSYDPLLANQYGSLADVITRLGQHQGQRDSHLYQETRQTEEHRALDDRPSTHTGFRHRLLQTTPPLDEFEWTRKAANAHGIDSEVMRIIIQNMSADEFEDILAYYRGGRAYRATHRILAVYMRYHMRVPTPKELSMVEKTDAPFEKFALNTGPSGLFWPDWQNSHTLDDWRLVALAIFMQLGEEGATHPTDESNTDSNHATYSSSSDDDDDDGELSDDTLEDSSYRGSPKGQAARSIGTDERNGTNRPAVGHFSSSAHGEHGRKNSEIYHDHDKSNRGPISQVRGHRGI